MGIIACALFANAVTMVDEHLKTSITVIMSPLLTALAVSLAKNSRFTGILLVIESPSGFFHLCFRTYYHYEIVKFFALFINLHN